MRIEVARARARERFAEVAAEERVALDRGALWIAAEERPTPWPHRALDELQRLADGVGMPSAPSSYEAVARLNLHLFEELGLHGAQSDYDAPRNSCLDQVLQRRRGLPILLSVVYIEVARRCGVKVDGVSFPGHFLVSPEHGGDRFYVDPFDQGRILRRPHLESWLRGRRVDYTPAQLDRWLSPADNRQILARVCRNLKHSWLRRGDLEGALRSSERILLLYPGLASEQRDRAMLLARLGRQSHAEQALAAWTGGGPTGEC